MKPKEVVLTSELLLPFEGGEIEITTHGNVQFRGRVQKNVLGGEKLEVQLLVIKEITGGVMDGKERHDYAMCFDLKRKQKAVIHENTLICTVEAGEKLVFFTAAQNRLDIKEAVEKAL